MVLGTTKASAASWTYYQRSATPVRRSSQPPAETHVLVRYDVLAATQLDAAGKARAGASFPDSSIIVKALSNGTTVTTYAVLMKVRGSAGVGFDGSVWAERCGELPDQRARCGVFGVFVVSYAGHRLHVDERLAAVTENFRTRSGPSPPVRLPN